MAGNIHNGPKGPGPCGASGKGRGCPFDPEGTGENHFGTKEEAQAAFDTKMESEHGLVATATKAPAESEDEINARINEETYSPLKDLRGPERYKTNAIYWNALKDDYQTGLHEVRLENGYEDGVPADGGSEQYKADLAAHSKVYKDAKAVFEKYSRYETEEEKSPYSDRDPYEYLKKLDRDEAKEETADLRAAIENDYADDLDEIKVDNGYQDGVPTDGGSEEYKAEVAARTKAYENEKKIFEEVAAVYEQEEDDEPECTCGMSDCADCGRYGQYADF